MSITEITVCKDCTDRYPACWGSCPKYIEEHKRIEAQKQAENSMKKKMVAIWEVQYTSYRKAKKEEIRRKKRGRK